MANGLKSAKRFPGIRNNLEASCGAKNVTLILEDTGHEEMLSRLSAATIAPAAEYLALARHTLKRLLEAPALLDRICIERKPGAYTRNLIYGDDRITVYAIVWAAGSQTSIHDHHCSCCFGVLSGAIRETWYETVDANHAVPTKNFVRETGHIAGMLPSGPNLHKMTNDAAEEAISIHIYGYASETRPSSIDCEYLLSDQRNA
jgi:predicted metal-dependent enzyme (double-stranded beta helix superfamily)